jgi:N-acetylglutamate synthase-like GNAT family acetyltransferase
MRHARDEDLDRVETLLTRIRLFPTLVERKRGIFYRRGQAFLHFHEHAGEMFADVRINGEFERLALNTGAEDRLIAIIAGQLAEG